MRDDFTTRVKDTLAKRVALQCSRLGCGQVTHGPNDDAGKFVNVGVAAHITAASPGGPRYDASLSSRQRASHENGIWLCQTCAKLIDSDATRYPATTLREWKAMAEQRADQALLDGPSRSQATAAFVRLERLVPALFDEMRRDLNDRPLLRDCVVLSRKWTYWAGGTEFVYYLEEHPDLKAQFRILENYGLVHEVTTGNVTKFRMSEDLAEYLGVR